MTPCDWSVSDVVKTSPNNDLKISLLVLCLTGAAVSRLILRLKAKELCTDPEFKASLHWYQNIGKSTMPSACERRQPWFSNFLKIWKRRWSSSNNSWLQVGSSMAIRYPRSSIQMKHLSHLSFCQAEPLNSVPTEPFQWSPWCQEEELYGDTCSCRRWQQITACSDLQRWTHSALS